jgi:hypothetical protein
MSTYPRRIGARANWKPGSHYRVSTARGGMPASAMSTTSRTNRSNCDPGAEPEDLAAGLGGVEVASPPVILRIAVINFSHGLTINDDYSFVIVHVLMSSMIEIGILD